jgi:hypothetical protein
MDTNMATTTTTDRDDIMRHALARIIDVTRHHRTVTGAYLVPCQPDSADYGDDTAPGSPWDEACDALLAEIREALPAGWSADWSDSDLRIDDTERE